MDTMGNNGSLPFPDGMHTKNYSIRRLEMGD